MPSYRSLVAQRRWRRFLLASTAARLPITMGVFGMVLAGHALGSFSLGARLAAVYTLTGAATAVWRGRRLDRGDMRRGLRRDGLVVAVLAIAITACVLARLGGPVAVVLAVALGIGMAAIPGGYRAMVPSVVELEDVEAAYALDAVCVEFCFVTGPAVAAITAWFAGPSGVFVLMALCALVGAWGVARLPEGHPGPAGSGSSSAPHRIPIMMGVLAGTISAGMGLGVLDATFPPFAVTLGTRAAVGGAFVTLMALGSGTAGLVLGPRVARGHDLGRQAALLLLVFGAACVPLAVAPSVAWVVVLAFVAGAPFALMTTSVSVVIQRSVAPSRTTEAFSLLNAGLLLGDAGGNALASAFLGPWGSRGTLALAGAGPVAGAVLLVGAITVSRHRGPGAGTRDMAPAARLRP